VQKCQEKNAHVQIMQKYCPNKPAGFAQKYTFLIVMAKFISFLLYSNPDAI